jgi:hypothetical protein
MSSTSSAACAAADGTADHSAQPSSLAQRQPLPPNAIGVDPRDPTSSLALRLRGKVDVAAVRTVLDVLLARHETLVGAAKAEPALSVVDLTGEPDRLAEVLRAELTLPWDPDRGPLLRILLVRSGRDEHLLALSAYRTVVDQRSMELLATEFGALYRAAVSAPDTVTTALPAPSAHYTDFSQWQQANLSDRAKAGRLAYWRKTLTELPALELPTDRPRVAMRGTTGATHERVFPAQLNARLAEFTSTEAVTLFSVLMTATQVLFGRRAHQSDVAVGTVASGRDEPELAGLVGSFASTVLLRSQVDECHSFWEILTEVSTNMRYAFANAAAPLDRPATGSPASTEAGPTEAGSAGAGSAGAGGRPLFDVLVLFRGAAALPRIFGGLRAEPVDLPTDTANVELTVEFEEREDSVRGRWNYRTELFDESTVAALATGLEQLLRIVLDEPDRALHTIEFAQN